MSYIELFPGHLLKSLDSLTHDELDQACHMGREVNIVIRVGVWLVITLEFQKDI